MELNSTELNKRPQLNGAKKIDTTETKVLPENSEKADFKEVVEQSREAIKQEATKPLKQKKARGRPVGSTTKNKDSARPTMDANAVPPTPPPNISKQLSVTLQGLSKVPAANLGIPELALTSDEAMICAESLNQVLQAFVPDVGQMNPKTAAVIGAFSVFGSIGFSKYSIYVNAVTPKEIIEPGAKPDEKTEGSGDRAPDVHKNIHPLDYLKNGR